MDDLIKRLEEAKGPDRDLDLEIWCQVFAPDAVAVPLVSQWNGPRITASVDYALAMVPYEFEWQTGSAKLAGKYWAHLVAPNREYRGNGATPAIALCIAALKARAR